MWGVGVWHGDSPDLNPIENIWAVLKDSINIEPIPTTIDALKIRLDKTWDSLFINLLEKRSECLKTGYNRW